MSWQPIAACAGAVYCTLFGPMFEMMVPQLGAERLQVTLLLFGPALMPVTKAEKYCVPFTWRSAFGGLIVMDGAVSLTTERSYVVPHAAPPDGVPTWT